MKPLLVGAMIVAALFTGCATPYQNDGLIGGASETQLSATQWNVRFRANAYTTPDKAADLCLLRCADIALREGYPFFALIGSDTRVDHQTWEQQGTYHSDVKRTGANTYQATTTGGPTTWDIRKPTANNTVVLLKEQTPRGDAYESAIVAASLRKKYGIK